MENDNNSDLSSFLWKKINHIEINDTACLGDKISISNDGYVFAIGDTKHTNNYGKIFVFKSSLHSDAVVTSYSSSSAISTVSSSKKILYEQVKPYDPIKKSLLSLKKQVFSLKGEFEEEFLGHAFEISGNGRIFITGEPYFNDCTGRIRLFDIEKNESYSVEGADFFEKDERDEDINSASSSSPSVSHNKKKLFYFGWDVGINENGDTIGIISNDDHNGNLKIFKKSTSENQYEELQTIEDEYFTPLNVKFSYNGDIVCISEKLKNKDSNLHTEGRLRIFKYSPSRDIYIEFGSHPISGSKLNGLDSLYNFKLNKEGNIIIFGESSYSTNDKKNRGRVRVFQYDENLETWNVVGNEFLGENEGDFCGSAVDINEKGDIIVFSERNFTSDVKLIDCGRVRSFQFNSFENEWQQFGQTIQGDFEGDNTGLSLKISSDSQKLFIGEPLFNGKGRVRIFEKFYEKGVFLSDGLPLLASDQKITVKNDDNDDAISCSKNSAITAISSVAPSITSNNNKKLEIKAVINPKNNKIEEKVVIPDNNTVKSKKKNVTFNPTVHTSSSSFLKCNNSSCSPHINNNVKPKCTSSSLLNSNNNNSTTTTTTLFEAIVNFFLFRYPSLILLLIILLAVLLYWIIVFY